MVVPDSDEKKEDNSPLVQFANIEYEFFSSSKKGKQFVYIFT